ncbi:hypothetical protein ABEB36_002254 [Hypothenemus hampei]|uniref:Ig-like domain-containing protein n=1 Tax=Hypothenemus hampei TaxID=57062 RepID=A0ABD1F566_HYPHA
MKNFHFKWIIVWFFLNSTFSLAVEIHYIKVPNAVQNNTNRPTILDCKYSIRPDDSELVVQWYLNEELVYQWIPPNKPQSLGVLKDEVDLEYTATDDPKTVYRSVKLNNPTSNMAGEYKCSVSTLGDQDSALKSMIVFEPEQHLNIRKTMDQKYVNFTCQASEVYPSPKLVLYKQSNEDIHSKMWISTTQWDIKKNPETRKYTMFIVGTEKLSEIDPGTLVFCELKIPKTEYVKIKSLLYYPDGQTITIYKINRGQLFYKNNY